MQVVLEFFIFRVFSSHFGFASDWQNWGENVKFKMTAWTTDENIHLGRQNPPALQATSGSHFVTGCFLKEANSK